MQGGAGNRQNFSNQPRGNNNVRNPAGNAAPNQRPYDRAGRMSNTAPSNAGFVQGGGNRGTQLVCNRPCLPQHLCEI